MGYFWFFSIRGFASPARKRREKRLSSVFFRPDSGGPNNFGNLVETKRKLGYVNRMNIVEYCLHTVGVVENPVDNVKNSL